MEADSHSPPFPLLTQSQVEFLAQKGHLPLDLPTGLLLSLSKLSTALSTFFSHPKDIKAKSYPARHGTELGYYHIPGEKEYVTLRSQTGIQSPLDGIVQETWHGINILLNRILSDVSYGLGLEFSAWDPLVRAVRTMPTTVSQSSPSLMRLFNYFPNEGQAEPHCDNGLLTLCVGSGRGLQVKGDNGDWEDVKGPTVLVGDTLRILSFNRVKSGAHRVIGNENGRTSIVYALRPAADCEIDLADFGAEGTVNMGELWKEIVASKVNVNAQKHIREEQTKRRKEQLAQLAKTEGPM